MRTLVLIGLLVSYASAITHIFSQTTGETSGAIVSLFVEEDGSHSDPVTLYRTENSQPTSLSTDIWDKVLFWGTKDGRLFKGDVQGSASAEEATLTGMTAWTNPRGIAAVHKVRNVYWTFYDTESGYELAARKGYGKNDEVVYLAEEAGLPDGNSFGPAIEIDDDAGLLYWCWNAQILRAPLNSDGSIASKKIENVALLEEELTRLEVVDINISEETLYFAQHQLSTGETGLYYIALADIGADPPVAPTLIHRFFTASTQHSVTVDIDPESRKLLLVANLVEGRVYWWPLESDGSVKPGVPEELEGITGMTDVAIYYSEFPLVLALVGFTVVALVAWIFVIPYFCPGMFAMCRSAPASDEEDTRDPQEIEDDLLLDEPRTTTVLGRVSRTASTVSDRLKENFYLISSFGRRPPSESMATDDGTEYKPLE